MRNNLKTKFKEGDILKFRHLDCYYCKVLQISKIHQIVKLQYVMRDPELNKIVFERKLGFVKRNFEQVSGMAQVLYGF